MDQSMLTMLVAGIVLSVFHALIPSHWLPIIAIGKKESWTYRKIISVTFLAGLSHVLSTLLLGLFLAFLGRTLSTQVSWLTQWAAPVLLIVLGAVYIYRHYNHKHFHLSNVLSERQLIFSLALAMFLSPCLEIEGYFIAAAAHGWPFIFTLAFSYAIVSLLGMLLWVVLVLRGLRKLNWHAWEHNAGLITGIVLILLGIALLLLE